MMMNIFRRHSQKEYDGPAIAANKSDWMGHPPQDKRQQPRRHSSLDAVRRRSSGTNGSRNTALASGISSRRTSERVSRHLPTQDMGPAAEAGARIPTNIEFACDSLSPNQDRRKEKKPMTPMEHDGGVLCLCAIPDNRQSSPRHRQNEYARDSEGGGRTHRFLSGGADGTVKLWVVHETPLTSNGGNGGQRSKREMIPKLVRTYRGHSGYVHSIAVLGTLSDPVVARDGTQLDESRRSYQTTSSGDSSQGGRRRSLPNMSKHLPSSIGTRMSHLAVDSSGSDRMKQFQKRTLFVSASRDNTMRIWAIDGSNSEHESCLDECDGAQNVHGNGKKEDPYAKGMKLRGHHFGSNAIGGVLCVCAVPSLATEDDSNDEVASNDDGVGISAGQFCSGGSDGRIRVWDVRSALHLKKAPKSGMYGTVQLQCINPEPGSVHRSQSAAAITSLVCTHRGLRKEGTVALFAGDANGIIRRYGKMNECGTGHINGAIWWGCTGVFAGHRSPIASMGMLSSPLLIPLLCPNIDDDDAVEEGIVGAMLVSSGDDGSICVWDAYDARPQAEMSPDCSERSGESLDRPRARMPKRRAMWKIELNDGSEIGGCGRLSRSQVTKHVVGVTSLATLQTGTSIAAGTTDGSIRMWNVSSGFYEGAYNLGQVQIWSLDVLSEQGIEEEDGEALNRGAGIIVSGDNRGRIRVLRKLTT